MSCCFFASRSAIATVLGRKTVRMLLSVFGGFSTSAVVQSVCFHVGNTNSVLFRPRFSNASRLLFWQRLSSFVIDRDAVSASSASDDSSTQSYVSPKISPIRIEQPSAKSIASFKTGFSQIASAYLTSLADHEARSLQLYFGSVTFSAGFAVIYFHATALRNAPRIRA